MVMTVCGGVTLLGRCSNSEKHEGSRPYSGNLRGLYHVRLASLGKLTRLGGVYT